MDSFFFYTNFGKNHAHFRRFAPGGRFLIIIKKGDGMLYRFYPQTDQTRFIKLNRSKIPYRTVREMQKLYPDGNFVIIGEVGSFAKALAKQDTLLMDNGKAIPIFPRGTLLKPFEWVPGYIAVEKSTYAAAVRSIFPAFLRSRIKALLCKKR